MLKTFTQTLKHPCSMWLLIAVGCFACVGCQTIGPEVISERNHRIKAINAKLYDNMQILLSFARQEDVDLDLANKALDGVFAIIGHPDSQEILLAKCLDESVINSLITTSMDLRKERLQLTKDNERDSAIVSKNFHDYKESHETLTQLKWIAGVIVFLGAICFFVYRPKLF